MDTAVSKLLPESLPVVSLVTVLVLAFAFLAQRSSKNALSSIPLVGVEMGNAEKRRAAFLKSGRKIYAKCYDQFKDGVCRISGTNKHDNVVIGRRYLEELRRLPDDVLSVSRAINQEMEAKYTNIDAGLPLIPHTVKADLTPALLRLNPRISHEVKVVLQQEMPACDDWTELNIYEALLRIVAKVSGSIFVGAPYCYDEEYLDSAINYSIEVSNCPRAIKKIRPFLRPFLAPRLPEVRKLRKREDAALAYLKPIVLARQEAEKKEGYEKPDDMLQWFMNKGEGCGQGSIADLAKAQLTVSFAAIHTTTLTCTNALFSLAAEPEKYLEPLRDEIRTVLARHDGAFTNKALQEMEKLDSVLKETMRLYPPGLSSFMRKAVQPFTLSTGQYIPAGTFLEVPTSALHHDPALFPNSDQFDGFRFYHLRQNASSGEVRARNQLVSISETSLGFGYGRHACPGRFFAANEIKMIMGEILLAFDFKNLEGFVGRYPNVEFARTQMPDASRALLFRKVKA